MKACWRLTRRVSPLEAEVILELMRRAGRDAPHFLETATGKRVRIELIYDSPPPRLTGWKRERLRSFDLAANNALRKPLRIGRSWLIAPLNAPKAKTERAVILMEPGLGFGSGQHETTRLCLELLENIPPSGSLLDLGTGSGILAIAAARRGFGCVTALEVDRKAMRSARDNGRRNQARSIRWVQADLGQWKSRRQFDVVTANLLSGLLIREMPRIARWVRSGGRLVVSGILREERRSVQVACRRSGFVRGEWRQRGRWCAGMMVKS
jgi:ribosomal protein L11 methyltransferase